MREREPWEIEDEAFDAATVLDDLAIAVDGPGEATAVLARYTVLRLALRAAAGTESGRSLLEERIAAAQYVARSGALDEAEREALAAVIRLAGRHPVAGLVEALADAGIAAATRGHVAGAFALHRACYTLALARGWTWAAAQAAAEIAALAEAGGGRWAVRRWRRRARVLERRAARDA
ncbi:MAG TPA: hypothetical protein VF188_13800 [Longimicrobiales bacterium]